MTETNKYPEIEYVVVERKRPKWWKRPGCWFIFVVWFIVMMIPTAILLLAFQGNITIGHPGDVPNSFRHPLVQVRLIMEIDERGLAITNSAIDRTDANNMCIQTDVRFWLWLGEGEPARFCDCYSRDDRAEDWRMIASQSGECD